jgi:hypothetical protein
MTPVEIEKLRRMLYTTQDDFIGLRIKVKRQELRQ